MSGGKTPPSFEPLATELREVQRGQGRALMVVEGPHQAARGPRVLGVDATPLRTGSLLTLPLGGRIPESPGGEHFFMPSCM